MADPLCYIKELALKEVNPHLFTIATLTGHVIRAYGPNYTVILFKTKRKRRRKHIEFTIDEVFHGILGST